jgi:hypothetical protein
MMAGVVLAVTGLVSAVTGPLSDGLGGFTISNEDMATWAIVYDNPVGNATHLNVQDVPGNAVEFNFGLGGTTANWHTSPYYAGDQAGTFAAVQYGWKMNNGPGTLPSEYYDLSAYDYYTISIHNTSSVPSTDDLWARGVMVNLFINTGWTDIGESDHYYQNTWTWEKPCDNLYMVLDLTGIPDAELKHVSAIGFNAGSNLATTWGQTYAFPSYDSLVDTTIVKITTDTKLIPEPLTMLTLIGAIGGIGAYMRKRRTA